MENNTMLNTNRKLMIVSQTLIPSNKIFEEFKEDHDFYFFEYNPQLSLLSNCKRVYKDIKEYIMSDYQHIVFMGHGQDCNVLYGLYEDKNLVFDAGVFVNYESPTNESVPHQVKDSMSPETKIYSYSTHKKNLDQPIIGISIHQYVPTLLGGFNSKRLAQEIYGAVVYDTYSELFLQGPKSVFI